MLSKAVTDAIVIEPRSHEDVEATVKDPDAALIGVTGAVNGYELVLQAKSRSTAPWTTQDIAAVLRYKPKTAGKAGPPPRQRPLAILATDPRKRYVFVTNESLDGPLRPFQGNGLLDWPDEDRLPPYTGTGYDATEQASIAKRIVFCAGVTEEVLQARIRQLLSLHGHVPLGNQLDCLRDLRVDVRRRLLGARHGRWSREELLATLGRHGGKITRTLALSHYVPPESFGAIQRMLVEKHAVVIVGPSGTGKTLTANFLENELRRSGMPFSIVGDEQGPGYVQGQLTRTGPVLFHLRDPWGSNRLAPNADRWNNELPKLLREASANHKFLITSRSDVLHSAGSTIRKGIAPYAVAIEIEDYGNTRLADIYDRMCGDLSGATLEFARVHRQRALDALRRPYEIDRFMVTMSFENMAKTRRIAEIIADSQIDAISRVLADQIGSRGENGVACAAIVWALLRARKAVTADVLSKLWRRIVKRDPSVRPELDSFIDFLVAGRNLRREGAALTFYHPKVEDGLKMVLESHRSYAEHMLALVCHALVGLDASGDDWGRETALGVLKATCRLDGVDPTFTPKTRSGLDLYLLEGAVSAVSHGDFERAFKDLADYSSQKDVPGQLARFIMVGRQESARQKMADFWEAPSSDDRELKRLRDHPNSEVLVSRFVSDVLPYSDTYYPNTIAHLLRKLVPDLDQAFWGALETVASIDGVGRNIGPIVTGVCAGVTHDFDAVIERFAAAEGEADKWMSAFREDLRRAKEHELDAAHADHLIEEPSERYYNPTEGMKAVVELRVAQEGVDWLLIHPHRELAAGALADLFDSQDAAVEPAQIRVLIGCAVKWARARAWSAAQKHWDASLDDLVDAELQRTDTECSSLRGSLVKIVLGAQHDQDAWVDRLLRIGRRSSAVRRLELVLDVATTKLEGDPRVVKGEVPACVQRGYCLATSYDAYEQELAKAIVDAVAEHGWRDIGNRLSPDARELLIRLMPDMPLSIVGAFACIAATAHLDVMMPATQRLLDTGEKLDGMAAIQALSLSDDQAGAAVMTAALKHVDYGVRRGAFTLLVRGAAAADRSALLGLSLDPSADVRLQFSLSMREHKWPEAIDALIGLLKDTRNFSSDRSFHDGPSWAHFRVARTAAAALASYTTLPVRAISALLAAAADGNCEDPFVACEALKAVVTQDDTRVSEALFISLQAPGIGGSIRYRPLSQAGAWGLVDRASVNKLELDIEQTKELIHAALTMPGSIAAPALCAIAILGGETRRIALCELDMGAPKARRELLLVASAVVGNAAGEIEDPLLVKLAERGENLPPDGSSDVVDHDLSTWSMELDPSTDVAGTTAWLASKHYVLPVAQPDFEPRKYELPNRVEVLTMRSLSPDREEYEGNDDGTAG
ncbi:hypothetical protein [Accumulibacter sp.]|uniref:nSTAND3 domain-containing NTPase n=1 Tax=Accumulibacter sp. TaxID=2053492 RepID=UPI002BE94449|nr:hypothetical protein [Accumulibacter sp.]HRF06809.1 hypothetical protein [Accumulibacter sp.]